MYSGELERVELCKGGKDIRDLLVKLLGKW